MIEKCSCRSQEPVNPHDGSTTRTDKPARAVPLPMGTRVCTLHGYGYGSGFQYPREYPCSCLTAAPSTAAVAATPGPAPCTPGPAPRTPVPALEDNGQGDDGTLSDDGGESHAIDNTAEFAQTSWPTDTDIVFPSGSAKMLLMNQTVMVKFVLHDAMEVV